VMVKRKHFGLRSN